MVLRGLTKRKKICYNDTNNKKFVLLFNQA